jgi:hypothetical protein
MGKIFLINTGKTQYIEGSLNCVTDGNYMFYQCPNLTSFNSDLSGLTDGNYMFYQCPNLTSFNSDLSSLTSGEYMFASCTNLTTFTSDLSSLTNAGSGSGAMFGSSTSNCTKLDLASVQNIAETINDLASQGKTGTIAIGMQTALQSEDETAPINVALAAIRTKGWTVTEIYA